MLGVAAGGFIITTSEGPWTTSAFTPQQGERLYLVLSTISANAAAATFTITDTQNNKWFRHPPGSFGQAFSVVFECLSTSIDRSMTVGITSSLTLGGIAAYVLRVSGYGKLRQVKSLGNQIANVPTPTVDFTNDPLPSSVCLAWVVNVNSGSVANITPPSGFTEVVDSGYTSPSVGFELAYKVGAFGKTITWGSASPANYNAMIAEIEQAAITEMDHFVRYGADSTYNVLRLYQPYSNPWNVVNGNGERPLCVASPANAWGVNGIDQQQANQVDVEVRYYGVAVAYIQYRKRETTTWPTGLIDLHAGLQWLVANAATYKLDLTRVCANGSSAGAANAALMALSGGSAAVGAAATPIGLIKSVLWFFGHNRSRLVDPAYSAIGISRGIPAACSVGSPEQEVLDVIPCSTVSFDWVSGDGGSYSDADTEPYNLFTPGWWASKYPVGYPKPVFELWHGTADQSIPYFCTFNPKTMGTGHALDNGFHQDLLAHGFTSSYTLLVGAGHGGSQFVPTRYPGQTNGAAVDAAIVRWLNAAGIVDTPIVVPVVENEVTLNGRTYQTAEFLGDDRLGYVDLFPDPLCADAVAQSALRAGEFQANAAAQKQLFNTRYGQLGLTRLRSNTSVSVGTGARSFTLTAPTDLNQGFYYIYSQSAPANRMYARLAADLEASSTFAVTVDLAGGSGTFTDWIITPLVELPRYATQQKTGAYTLVAGDDRSIIECTSGTFSITGLPVATAGVGYEFGIMNSGAGTITFDPSGAELVDNAASLVIGPGQSAMIVCTGTEWASLTSVLPVHAFPGTDHSVSGLTAGHVLKALAPTILTVGPLVAQMMPPAERRAVRAARIASSLH